MTPPGTVSVALATYNGASYLPEQLASLVAQTRPPAEIVVRDDGSTDGTLAVLRDFAVRAPFPVRVLPSGERLGYARNFGAVLLACSGDYVALCDQDDVWLPQKVERLAGVLDAQPDALLAFSDLEVVDEALRPTGRTMWEELDLREATRARFAMGWEASPLLSDYFVTGAATCFRASLLPLVLPIELAGHHDAWLALLAALRGRVVPVAEPLVLYRQHGRNQLGAPRAEGVWAAMHRRIFSWSKGDQVITELAVQRRNFLQAVWDRLDERGALLAGQREVLTRVIRHLDFRADIPPYPGRALGLTREVTSGRYHAFSGGWRTALRDGLRASVPPPAVALASRAARP